MKSPKAEDVRRCISGIWDTLQCPICLELMTSPVSTKCEHQFCKFCMQKLLDETKQRGTKCPVCKTKITKRSLQDSPGFMRLITGLQNMIEAYEKDTRTNYFTGMARQRRQQSMTDAGESIVISDDSSDTHHDNGDGEEHGPPCSHSSTIEAQNGFASLMDLEDSNTLVIINDCLDTSFTETPQTSGEKNTIGVGISPTVGPVKNQEMAEVVEKATSRPSTRGTKRIAQLDILSSRLSLVPEDGQQQQAPKGSAEKETKNPQLIQRRKSKSVEKVSEWLLQVPLRDNLDSEGAPDPNSYPEHPPASPTGSFSSDCTSTISLVEPEANGKTEEQVRSLEDQVFGIVYTRRGKRSFSPPQHHLVSHDLSLLSEEHKRTRSKRPQNAAEEVLESSAGKCLKKTAISLRGPIAKVPRPDNHDLAKPVEEAKNIVSHLVNQPMLNASKGDGCICDEDVGGIEQIESVEAVTPINGSTVPNSFSPCEMGAACIMPTAPTCSSPTEAAEPRPNPETIKSTTNNAHIVESTTRIDSVAMEEKGDFIESEVDTEQLMKSFRVAKRKSFHLCSPMGRKSIVSADKDHQNSKTEDNFGSGTELITNQISKTTAESATLGSERLPETEKASCGNRVASSSSPSCCTSLSGVRPRRSLRRRPSQSEEVLKLDGTPLTKSQQCVGCLSKNPVYSALSPNKAAKSPSPHCTVTPYTSDSVLLFSTLEVAEDGSLGMTSRSAKRLQIMNKSQQPTKINLEEITLPNTRLEISTDMSAKQGNTDNSVEVMLNTNASITPDGLVPSVEESADIAPPSSSSPSASYPIRNMILRKRKSQRLESSSEEELPSLAQILKSHLPATKCNPAEGQLVTQEGPGVVSGFKELCLSAPPQANLPVSPPSQDELSQDELSQASVDLFDTPAECDMAAIDNGVPVDSSQFSSELLVTQQKQAMQKELLRLGNLMALVTEVLQEKEDGSATEQQPAGQPSTGRDLSMPCDQEVKQIASDPAPIQTLPSLVRPDKTAEAVLQISRAKRHRTRLSGDSRTPGSQGSNGNTTVAKTPPPQPQPPPPPSPPPSILETRDQVTRGASVTPPTHDAAARKPECVFVSSGLGSDEKVVLKNFAKRIGARVEPQVTPKVTHVIMRTDDDLVVERTLKYFLGIAGRKWVVSFLWISECFKRGELLDETAFEVRGDVVNGADHQGPLRARRAGDQDLLMKDYKICFQGSFTDMTKDQMEWMVELCGAAVVKDPLQFSSGKRAHQLVIMQPGAETALMNPSALSGRATVVNRDWLMDSVATYTLQNQDDYRV